MLVYLRVTPSIKFITNHLYNLSGGERHCESNVPCPRTGEHKTICPRPRHKPGPLNPEVSASQDEVSLPPLRFITSLFALNCFGSNTGAALEKPGLSWWTLVRCFSLVVMYPSLISRNDLQIPSWWKMALGLLGRNKKQTSCYLSKATKCAISFQHGLVSCCLTTSRAKGN